MNHSSWKSYLSECVCASTRHMKKNTDPRGSVFFHMAEKSPSTQVGHLKASSEIPEFCVASGAWCPLSPPTTGCADQHATELLVPICPRTCGTCRKGHLAKFLQHVELGLCAKGAISHTFQSHVERRKTIACSANPSAAKSVFALRHW